MTEHWRAVWVGLLPRAGGWGVVPGVRATVAAAIVLGGAVAVADLSVGGIAYLGVACAVSFVGPKAPARGSPVSPGRRQGPRSA